MDKDLRLKKIMFKDIIKKDDLGKVFIDNDVANVIKEAGFVIMTDELAKKFLSESLELSKLKVERENEKNGNNT
jgi:hypothetical protein